MKRREIFRGHRLPVPPRRRIAGELHASLAPVEHVDGDYHKVAFRELRAKTAVSVVRAFELRQHRRFRSGGDDLLFAPREECSMVVQRDHGGAPLQFAFGQQQVSRNANIRRRVEVEFLPYVFSAIHPLHNLDIRGTLGRIIVQQLVYGLPSDAFPCLQVLKTRIEK